MEKLIPKTGNQEFEPYQPRKIAYMQSIFAKDYHVKVYTITNRAKFESNESLKASIKALPIWLENAQKSSIITHRHAFLIVHEAREGILVLLNWWTGENMVETNIYFASFREPSKVTTSIYKSKTLVCIWELEIFSYERKAWIKHVLSKAPYPDFDAYQNDYYQQNL